MKKIVIISLLLMAILSGCDDKDYEPYEVTVNVLGDGNVTGAGIYSYGTECKLVAKEISDSEYRFTGWYIDEKLVSREKEYIYNTSNTVNRNQDVEIKAVFSNNVFSIKLYYIQKFQKELFVEKGDELYIYASDLKDWQPLYQFLGWEAIDSQTGEAVEKSKSEGWRFTPKQNLMIFTDWDMS
ncbi:MAG: InlB B-repeat-containing protein [Dysgonomonas sp.]